MEKFITHICHDDKFLDMAVDIFEATYPGQNKYLLFRTSNKLKYIKKKVYTHYPAYQLQNKKFVKENLNTPVIIFHALQNWKAEAIPHLPSTSATIWFPWGFDYYYGLVKQELILPITRRALLKIQKEKGVKIPELKENYPNSNRKRQFLKRIDIATWPKEVAASISKDINIKNFKSLEWFYYTLSKAYFESASTSNFVKGSNILIGNSASPANNHLDLFNIIKDINLNGRKIITPLSYGNAIYAQKVIEQGRNLFGKAFIPITKYLPFEEYKEITLTCSTVMMNHIRQQAFGNILNALQSGATVYLHSQNPLTQYFKSNHVHILETDSVQSIEDSFSLKLTNTEKKENLIFSKNILSTNESINRTKNLILAALRINQAKQDTQLMTLS